MNLVALGRENEAQNPWMRSASPSFLEYVGTWTGDDFQQCLEAVYANGGQVCAQGERILI